MYIPSNRAPTAGDSRPRVLLVDDEPAILDALRRQLRRSFDVTTAVGGSEALQVMESEEPFSVVLSDMRMPGMDGAAFLAIARERWPDTVRMLLTGQADMQSTVAAINDGQIFRFLSKPCPAGTVELALQDAAKLHSQMVAERDVLERTLRGAVQALLDVLSLASPKAFSRAGRVSKLVGELAETIGVRVDWELGISGQLAQLGAVTVPLGVLEKLDAALPLTADERAMVDAVPAISQRLIADIPRLGPLAEAIGQRELRYDGEGSRPGDPVGDALPLAARLLKIALDIDAMHSQRIPGVAILRKLRENAGAYDPRILDSWEKSHTDQAPSEPVPFTVEIDNLKAGMVLAADVLNLRGVILLGSGSIVTETLLHRMRNHALHGEVTGPMLVTDPART